ncbi:MAG: flavodoxin family protein [Candidatus Geothermincolia bacterium]
MNEFRVLGLSCSPRKKGNTDLMCDSALEGAEGAGASVEKVHVATLDIHPCRECNACFKDGRCVQKDDMQELYPKLLSYEGIVLASPIFSMNLAAQAKILIDRLQCIWARKYVLKEQAVADDVRGRRRGLWLSAAGLDKPAVFDPAVPTVRYFFAMLEIGPWEKVLYHNVDDKGAIEGVPGALEACREAGARLVTD